MKTRIRKIKKRILALLLCIGIATAIMPVQAYEVKEYTVVTNKTVIDLNTMNQLLNENQLVYRIRTGQELSGGVVYYAYIGGDNNETFTPKFGTSYFVEASSRMYGNPEWYWDGMVTFKQGYDVTVQIEGLADTENVYVDIGEEQYGHNSTKKVIVNEDYTITPNTISQHDFTVSVTKFSISGEETLVSGDKNKPITWKADTEVPGIFPIYKIKVVYTDNRIEPALEASETPLTLSGSDTNIINSLSQKVKLKSGSSEITGKNIYFKTTEGNELTSEFMLEKADGDEFAVKAYFDGDDTYQPASAEIPVKVSAAFQVNNIAKDFTGNPITVNLNETGHNNGEIIYYAGNKQLIGAPTNPGNYYYRVKDGNQYSNYGNLHINEIAPTVSYPNIKDDLVYNGAEQELFINGSSDHGKWLYTNSGLLADSNLFLVEVPKAKDAGTYKWWYKFHGNTGYSDSEKFTIDITISPKPITVDLESSNITKIYDGTKTLENVEIKLNGVESGDEVKATATITYDNKNVGTGKTITASNIVLSGASAKNYTVADVSATGTGEIVPRNISLIANNASKTYGDLDPEFTYEHTELVEGDTLEDIILTRTEGENAGEYTINASQLQGANPNYNITFYPSEFTIYKREIIIDWGKTEFKYTGQKILPEATITNLVGNDKCELEIDLYVVFPDQMAGIDAGRWWAEIKGLSNSNYKLPSLLENRRTTFTIINADQEKPVLTSTNETIDDKKDGTISGLTAAMEYRKSGEEGYTAITDAMLNDGTMKNLSAGTYFVRYEAKKNYNASADTEVIVSSGNKLSVSIPKTQDGYTLTVDNAEVSWNGAATLNFELKGGYSKTKDFAIKVNNETVTLNADGKYTISNIQQNQAITVEGVADTTAPNAEIKVEENKWNSFLKGITFGLFFKETQEVTITADDVNTGSGLDKLYYFLSAEEIEEEKIESVAEWTEYNGPFNIDPDNEYIIYAKAVDKAGNIKYISSEIIVLDSVVPIIEGVVDGETYYTTQKVTITDKNIGTVTINGNSATENITLEGNTEATYIIVATDEAGNSTTVTVTMKPISDLSAPIDSLTKDNVNSSNEGVIDGVIAAVEAIDTTNATETEKKTLSVIVVNATALKEVIDNTKAEIDRINEELNKFDSDTVNSDDAAALEQLSKDIDALTQTENLTEDEKKALEDTKEKAEGLLDTIEDVAKATDTENTEKVKDVTAENVTPKDKTDLEKAKEDLEKALEDYASNMTEDEKKAVEDEIKCIDDALEVIGNVEAVEELIDKLPDIIKKDDEAAIKTADDALGALSDYEKSLVDKDAKKALDDAKAALAELNKPADSTSPDTGDNSNMMLWIALLFISGGLSITLTVVDRKRKTVKR